jgi:ABC-type polysaccharide/polyol phosphate transport system ATPase subunit
MDTKYSVILDNVTKTYKIQKNKKIGLREFFGQTDANNFYALKNVDLKVKKGDVVGILGINGSGKSTLSLILSGVSVPTSGNIIVEGEQALIAINSCLNNKLTGIENIELKGLMLGFTKEKIKEILEPVIEFADLGDFINQPVKSYSSGMKSRLGFAISVYLDPDILIIDEALSVGDSTFTDKCLNKMDEFKEKGKTIFFVSHSLSSVKQFCNKGLWLENGQVKEYGDLDETLTNYENFLSEYKRKTAKEKKEFRNESQRSRIVKVDKHKNKLKKKTTIAKVMSVFFILSLLIGGSLAFYKNGRSTVPAISMTGDKSTKNLITQKKIGYAKNYTFAIIRTNTLGASKNDKYRKYLLNLNGELLDEIELITFNKNGYDIELLQIPTGLQVDYEDKGFTDELRYSNVIQGEKISTEILDEYSGKKIDAVMYVNEKKLVQALAKINISLNITGNNVKLTLGNTNVEYTIGNREQVEQQCNAYKLLLENIACLSDNKKQSFFQDLEVNDSKNTIIQVLKTYNEIIKVYNDYNNGNKEKANMLSDAHKGYLEKSKGKVSIIYSYKSITYNETVIEQYLGTIKNIPWEYKSKKLLFINGMDNNENIIVKSIKEEDGRVIKSVNTNNNSGTTNINNNTNDPNNLGS